jgi:hypothetical protein
MIGFGVLVLICAAVGWSTGDACLRAGIMMGVAMIVAGMAAGQGRRSLRKTGIFLGMFLPVLSAGFCGWRAYEHWTSIDDSSTRLLAAILLTIMSAAGALTVLVLAKLRAGNNIAERGYPLTPLAPPPGETSLPRRADRT